jgi:hypothetical protein
MMATGQRSVLATSRVVILFEMYIVLLILVLSVWIDIKPTLPLSC